MRRMYTLARASQLDSVEVSNAPGQLLRKAVFSRVGQDATLIIAKYSLWMGRF